MTIKGSLYQRISIDGQVIGTAEVLSLETKCIVVSALDPPIPEGTYIDLEFVPSSDCPKSKAFFKGVVIQSREDEMEIYLESINNFCIEVLSYWIDTKSHSDAFRRLH